MNCPSIKELLFYLRDPSDSMEQLPDWEAHLSQCRHCQDRLDQLANEESLPELLGLGPEVDNPTEFPPRDLLRVGLDGYQIHEVVGKGGFGQVYRATHLSTGRTVAIKYSTNADPDDIALAKSEAEIAANLDHPHLVRLFDYGSQGTCSYTVFEWVDTDLQQRLKGNPLSLDQAVTCFLKIADVVAYLHRLQLIHRDLKPSNILLTSDDEPKLADFGIMKRLSDQGETRFSRVIGTPEYMAPEQLGYLGLPADRRVDIYGLGGVLYAMLSGKSPYQESQTVTLRQVIEVPPTPLHHLDPSIPEDLSQITAKCLSKLPSDRYACVDELIEDIQRWQHGFPVSARPLPWYVKSWRFARRQPALLATISLLLVCIVSLLGLLTMGKERQPSPTTLSPSVAWAQRIGSSGDQCIDLFEEARRELSDSQFSLAIQTLSESSPISPTLQLGVLAYAPNPQSLPPSLLEEPQGWQTAVANLPLTDIHRLASHLQLHSEPLDWLEPLRGLESFRRARDDQETRRWIAWMSGLNALDLFDQVDRRKLLTSLRDQTPTDMETWRQMLEPAREALLDTFLHETSANHASTNLSADRKPTLFQNTGLQAWFWPWIQLDRVRLQTWIQLGPWDHFGRLKQAPESVRQDALTQLMVSWDRATAPTDNLDAKSAELRAHLEKQGGLLTAHRGYATAIPLAQLPIWIERLQRAQWSPCSLQVYQQAGQTLMNLTIEKLDAPFEIEIDLPWTHWEDRRVSQVERGFQPIAVWGWNQESQFLISTIWSQGPWSDSQLLTSGLMRQQVSDGLNLQDPRDWESQIMEQRFPPSAPVELLALVTHRRIPMRIETDRRMVYLPRSRVEPDGDLDIARLVEYSKQHGEFALIPPSDPDRHREQASTFQHGGFEPIGVYFDADHQVLGSHWCKFAAPMAESTASPTVPRSAKSLAAMAWASYLLGNPKPLLSALDLRRDPTLRTELIEAASACPHDPSDLLQRITPELTPAQQQGLLLIVWNDEQQELREPSTNLQILDRAWRHPDGGVHYAAEKLLQRVAPEHLEALKGPHLVNASGESAPSDRQWYYGPAGLPFVIVELFDWELIGTNEELPWVYSLNRRLIAPNRRLAVSTIETPEWLMQQFQNEMSHLAQRTDGLLFRNPNGPAVGYDLVSILRFCRWYSEKSGLERESIALPTYDEIAIDMLLPSEPDGRPGYRLPTNYEWELVCRGGTWTPSPLGYSMEHLQAYSWNSSNSETSHFPTGLLKPNRLGLFDILGNAFEMALGETPESGFASFGPPGTTQHLRDNTVISLRGGSFLASRIYCTSGSQNHINAMIHDINAGFRIVQTLPTLSTQESRKSSMAPQK